MRHHHRQLALYLALCISIACAAERQVVLQPGDGTVDGELESCAPISDTAFHEVAGDVVSAFGNATYGTTLYSIHLSPYEPMLACVPQRRVTISRGQPSCTSWNATAPSDVVNKDGAIEVAYRRGVSSSHTLTARSPSPLLLAHAPTHPASLTLRLSVPHVQNVFARSNLAFVLGSAPYVARKRPAHLLAAADARTPVSAQTETIDRPVRRAAHALLRLPRGVPGCRAVVPTWSCETDARVAVPLRLRGAVAFHHDSAAPDASPVKVPVEHIIGAGVTWDMELRTAEEWDGIPRVVCDPRPL